MEVMYVCGSPFMKNESHLRTLNIEHYPAGEPLIRTTDVPTTILLRPKSLHTFMTTLFWIDALQDRGYDAPRLILPCVPGARQDRRTDVGDDQLRLWNIPKPDQLITLRSIASEINLRELPCVTVIDPHSDVTPGMIDRCRVISVAEVFRSIQGTWDGVMAPDGGAVKRASAVAQHLRVPLYHAWKVRDVATGQLTDFGHELRGGTNVQNLLLVDDLCDGGGTFVGLAKRLHADGFCNLSLYVTHGYFTKGLGEMRGLFQRIITTDSVLSDVGDVERANIAVPLLLGGAL